jgi:hypothetical protein
MKFEYEITKHPTETFKSLVYFCTESGHCDIEEVGGDEIKILTDILNDRGAIGWEFVQAVFAKDGVLIFWRRKMR